MASILRRAWRNIDRKLGRYDETTAVSAEAILSTNQTLARRTTEGQEQTLQSASAGGGFHFQGKGAANVRVWHQSDRGKHAQGRSGRWHA